MASAELGERPGPTEDRPVWYPNIKSSSTNSEVMALPGGAWIPGCPRSENPTRWKWLVVADGFLRTNNTGMYCCMNTLDFEAVGGHVRRQHILRESEIPAASLESTETR
ncbi:hypothetical protein DFH06DRAFT_1137853 [Mycena polygramma]|nr:hypothetical protein DFH06DRAFT_1137853 [Mycena polygramma]